MEANVEKYWAGRAAEYAETAYKQEERYPFYQVRLNLALDMLGGRAAGKILDAGCGGGNVLLSFLKQGWDGYGVDAVDEMTVLAKENLRTNGFEESRIQKSSITDLSSYGSESFDVVVCMGVMEYLRPEAEKKAFADIRRILKPDGLFLVENINNLFDLSTFNRFTVKFYEEHFLSKFFEDAAERDRLTEGLESLIANPQKPSKQGPYSTTRDKVFTKSEIPLTYGEKVKVYGFTEQEQAFYRFHAVPPLMFENNPPLEKKAVEYELKYSRHWIGNFLASGFISALVKTP